MQALSGIQDCSADWLSEAIGFPVESWHAEEIIGEGYASRMYRLHLSYTIPSAEAPASLILKLATVQTNQVDLLEANALFREVNFYAAPAAAVADMIPRVFVAAKDDKSLNLTLLMEDLGAIPHKPFRESLENSLLAMDALAKIHAAFWQAEFLHTEEFAPIESKIAEAELITLIQENMDIEARADYSFPYLRKCMQQLIKILPWMKDEVDQFQGPITLVHGDFHARNLNISKDRVTVFDWQTTERGIPARDVAYWIMTTIDVADTDSFKSQIIHRYLSALSAAGVENYSKASFRRNYFETMGQLIPRMYCYQSLVNFSDADAHELENFLARADKAAQSQRLLLVFYAMRIFAPIVISFLRLIGKR